MARRFASADPSAAAEQPTDLVEESTLGSNEKGLSPASLREAGDTTPHPTLNRELSTAIHLDPRPQYVIAQLAGFKNDTHLSRIKLGRVLATMEEKRNLAKTLGREVRDLFPAEEEGTDG